ncbi:MAG: hypothetical protein ACI4XE_02730 [Acutalibacteraceae bacterium]
MKKGTKIFIGIFTAVLALWLTMFSVDCNRCASLKTPVFAIEKTSQNSITEYVGLGYTAQVEKGKDAEPDREDVIIRSELRIFGKTVSAAIA